MKTITIGRVDCDIIVSDNSVSRKHASISLVDGEYVLRDMSRNGTVIGGRVYHNEKVVVAPGTPIYLANKVALPWAQVFMMLPNTPLHVQSSFPSSRSEVHVAPPAAAQSIGAFWGILSFFIPLIGFILYFVWNDTDSHKADQAATIAWFGFALNMVLGLLGGFTMY